MNKGKDKNPSVNTQLGSLATVKGYSASRTGEPVKNPARYHEKERAVANREKARPKHNFSRMPK